MSVHTFNLTRDHLKKGTRGSISKPRGTPSIISAHESVSDTLPAIGTWNSQPVPETVPNSQRVTETPFISQPISATINNLQHAQPLDNPSMSNATRIMSDQEVGSTQHYKLPGHTNGYSWKEEPTTFSGAHYIPVDSQKYKRVLQDDYDALPMKYSKPDNNQMQDKINEVLGSVGNSYHHIDRSYGYYQDRDNNIRSSHQDNTRNNQIVSSLMEKVNTLETENQQCQKTIADLQEKIKTDTMRSNELIEKYKQKDSEIYQGFLDLKKTYEETMHKVIYGTTMIKQNAEQSEVSRNQENVCRIMKALTALDVIEQTESDNGVVYICVIHGTSINYKFQLYIPNGPEQQVDYTPKDLDKLSTEAKSSLPEFLLDDISFTLDALPTVFWRLASSLQRAA